VQSDLLDARTAFATRAPEGAARSNGIIERVIEMDGDSPEVDAANAGNGRLSVRGSGMWTVQYRSVSGPLARVDWGST
jgi:hypothetical protein